jgi:hypothetical protein
MILEAIRLSDSLLPVKGRGDIELSFASTSSGETPRTVYSQFDVKEMQVFLDIHAGSGTLPGASFFGLATNSSQFFRSRRIVLDWR